MTLSLENDNKDNFLLPFNKTRIIGGENHEEVKFIIVDHFENRLRIK